MNRMDLVINGYGASLRKKSNRIVVEHDGTIVEYPVGTIRQILITGAASITSGVMTLAASEGIDLVVAHAHGAPSCRVHPCAPTGIVTTRRRQLEAASTNVGYHLVARCIAAKIRHMGRLVTALGKTRSEETLVDLGHQIAETASAIPPEGTLAHHGGLLRGIEGDASHQYFQALGTVLPTSVYRGHRTQHPAADLFNAYLNYGYGILYNEIERACLLAGLDPYLGYLHGDRYGHKAFVYDIIEPFRQPIVDRAIITLAVRHQMAPTDADSRFFLTGDGRRKAVGSIIHRLDQTREIGGRKTTFRDVIVDNVRSIVHHLDGSGPFVPLDVRWH